MIKKTYIPSKPRNPKLGTATGTSGAVGKTEFNQVAGSSHEHHNKGIIDQILQQHLDVLGVLSIVDGNLEIDANAYSTKELSAYGVGDGGGGGSDYERLDTWADYDSSRAGWVLSAFLGNDLNTRVADLENGSALTVNTTGTGNAITSISKAGSVITANKDLTFSLSGHTHPISDITNLQTALNSKLETTVFNTHNTDNIRHITGVERTKWDGVVTDFAGLEIGGRNYILTPKDTVSNNTYRRVRIENGVVYWEQLTTDTAGYGLRFSMPIIKGNYIISFKSNTNENIRRWINTSSGTKIFSQSETIQIDEDVWLITGLLLDLETSTTNMTFYGTSQFVPTKEVAFWDFKLEKGTKATDWTPAPEDQVSDWATTDVNSFSFIKNKPTLLSQFTDNIGVATHIANKTNPHSVTKAQVGLGNVDNTSDLNKPISTAMQNALNLKLDKSVFEDLFEKVEVSTGVFAIKAKYNFYGVGEISAYGIGSGGGSGGESYERLDTWASYDSSKAGWVLSAFLGKELDTRVINLENGSALTVNTTGTGNAITSISKAGSVITASKDLTFSLSGHTHPISDITNLQTALNSKLETTVFNTHNTDNIRHITGVERTKWDGVVTDFAGLEIGGRNYFSLNEFQSLSPESWVVNAYVYRFNLDPNTEYTVSSNVPEQSSTADTSIYFNDSITSNSGVWEGRPVTKNSGETGELYIAIPTGRWQTNNLRNGVYWVQFEKGNKPTDWSPAPEDQVSDWLTTDVNSFSFIKNKPTSLSQFTDNIGVATHIANKSNPHSVTKAQVGLGDVDNTADSVKNVLSATKLQTARTIAGVSFDGSANIAIPFANLASKPTTLAGYGITDGALKSLTLTAGNGLTGGGTLETNRTFALGTPSTLTVSTTNGVTTSSHTHAITTTSVGAANTIVQTDATGGTKLNNLMVGGAWKLEQVGTELQLKYNNVVAQRFLLDGSIVGLGEITAYGASTGGEGVSLLRTGGTMTGNLTMSANIIMNSGRAIGMSNLPLKLLGNALTYNASKVLTEANTATQIKMGNGWTIEQTTSALTIKKNGVVKGTFNA